MWLIRLLLLFYFAAVAEAMEHAKLRAQIGTPVDQQHAKLRAQIQTSAGPIAAIKAEQTSIRREWAECLASHVTTAFAAYKNDLTQHGDFVTGIRKCFVDIHGLMHGSSFDGSRKQSTCHEIAHLGISYATFVQNPTWAPPAKLSCPYFTCTKFTRVAKPGDPVGPLESLYKAMVECMQDPNHSNADVLGRVAHEMCLPAGNSFTDMYAKNPKWKELTKEVWQGLNEKLETAKEAYEEEYESEEEKVYMKYFELIKWGYVPKGPSCAAKFHDMVFPNTAGGGFDVLARAEIKVLSS